MSISASYPNLRPTLLLDFANSGRLDPRVTFTRASTATYFDETGVLRTAANNVPRFDYDPATLAARGFLIEEARTNLLTYSEDLTQSAWTTNSVAITPTADQTTAPDGNTTADIVVPTAVSSTHILRQFTSVTSGTAYSGSWFVKAAGYTFCQVTLSTGFDNAGALYRNFDLSTGTNGNGTLPASQTTIASVGNGWYRITVTATSTLTTANGRFNLNVIDADTASANPIYTGDGTSGIYIWGAQLEAGAFPTSVIPTTTTALTRSADVASVNTLSPWFNATEGTLYTESVLARQNATADNQTANIRNAANTSQIKLLYRGSGATGQLVIDTAVIQADLSATGVISANSIVKIALAYAANDFAASGNGGAVVTDTSGTVPSGIDRLDLGLTGLNGYIRRVTYYPRKLSSAELQAITA